MVRENCSPRAKESGEIECEEDVSVMKVDNGGVSGGALATLELAQGRLEVVNLLHDKLGELPANQEERKGAESVVLHLRRQWHGGGRRTEAAALRATGAPGV
jgi:hypothetical protein